MSSKIPPSKESFKERCSPIPCVPNGKISLMPKFIPLNSPTNINKVSSPINNNVSIRKRSVRNDCSPQKTPFQKEANSSSDKRHLHSSKGSLKSKSPQIDSEKTQNNEIVDIPIANRRPTRRAAPTDLREPLLKLKMRRQNNH